MAETFMAGRKLTACHPCHLP